MRKDLKYILFIAIGVVLYVTVETLTPKTLNWQISYSSKDKNPFGSYLINERLPDLFNDVENVNLTLYELKDSTFNNLLILAQNFSPPEEDTDAVLARVHDGTNAFIGASYFAGTFADTLNIEVEDYLFQGNIFQNISEEDTAGLQFVNPGLSETTYYYRRDNSQNYFSKFDTLKTTVLAKNDLDKPVLISVKWGQGNLLLCSTPLAFTNNYLIYQHNYEFVSKALSYLPESDLLWTEYYQLGRMEASTPLRFILTNQSLKWAYYITLLSLLFFIIFEAKRKQRIIPIITPLRNTTLEFVSTIGNLYYQSKDHKAIAEKKINFFMDQLRTRYFINIQESADGFTEKVAQKSGNDLEMVQSLFNEISTIRKHTKITEEQLKSLNQHIEEFKMN